MRYIKEESLANFEFWSGAKDRAELLTYSEPQELDSFVEELFEGREEELDKRNEEA